MILLGTEDATSVDIVAQVAYPLLLRLLVLPVKFT